MDNLSISLSSQLTAIREGDHGSFISQLEFAGHDGIAVGAGAMNGQDEPFPGLCLPMRGGLAGLPIDDRRTFLTVCRDL